MEKLFKQDSKGQIREWSVEVSDDKYRTVTGKEGGKLITSDWTICTSKNVGKANELSPKQQAQLEAEAAYTKKLKEGYTTDKAQAAQARAALVLPMLAYKYEDYAQNLAFPVFSQPKLDGFRCAAFPDALKSRKNEVFNSCPHILREVAAVCKGYNIVLDGELYNHDYKDNFDELQSLITVKKPTEEDLKRSKELVQYHVYDILDGLGTFSERLGNLRHLFDREFAGSTSIILVDTKAAGNQEQLDEHYWDFLSQGYEGQMVRTNSAYERKRSKTLLKRKPMQDAEFPIVKIEEGLGNRSGMAGAVHCRLSNGDTFGAGIKGGVAFNKKLWDERDELVGQMATIAYQNLTPDGVPRFPVFKAVRQDI